MVHVRVTSPTGHGELLTQPPYEDWRSLLEANRTAVAGWHFKVGGVQVGDLRISARRGALTRAQAFSARLGVRVRSAGRPEDGIVATGHQPDLYHPGVWVKDFLVQRFSDEEGATAVDVVVDTDGFEVLGVSSPCMMPGVARCRQYLALSTSGSCYACVPPPDPKAIEDFSRATLTMLESLPAPSIPRHFRRFVACLEAAAVDARNLAELITFARRRYEVTAGTDYLELPVTEMVHDEAFLRFAAHIALDARAFALAHNAELSSYRAATGTRSGAQPFPDLGASDEATELPFWWVTSKGRSALWAVEQDDVVALLADGAQVARLQREPDAAVSSLKAASVKGTLAPRAVTLTMYVRMLCCDLFVHGVGGGRYDRVTDALIERYFGVKAPAFVVASMTLYLPLGARVVSDEEVAAAVERLNRFEHNPDELLSSAEFDDRVEQERAMSLVAEKAALKQAIAHPQADKKALGARIRAVNTELADLLSPIRVKLAAELDRLRAEKAAADILTDRTYPFCFWDPIEVADKVR